MIKVGIIGAAGYTGGELMRILLNHPGCTIAYAQSRSQHGKKVNDVHTDLLGETELLFSDSFSQDVDIIFLCLGHSESKKFLAENDIAHKIRIIDLSKDFRLEGSSTNFIYGLPELNRDKIKSAENVANPGCFATAIQLALLPLAKNILLKNEVHISGITGSTGAGQKALDTTHFSWRTSNISLYKAFTHQHLSEIRQSFGQLQDGLRPELHFLPYRGNFTRGIFISAYMDCDLSLAEAQALYQNYYKTHPFVFLSDHNPDLKQVINTNKAIIHLQKHERKLLAVCVIDNLIKGASGQATQNMNLMFNLDETMGLKLKSIAF